MDFTFKIYKELLAEMLRKGYEFQTYADFIKSPLKKSIILRHDVDDKPYNSLVFAKIQAELGIKGVYYFRAVSKSWNEFIIKEISLLGHEIGYHYENLSVSNGNYKIAIEDFEKNLKKLRKIAFVETICMHGSPISKYDSRDLWKHYSYKDYSIIAEPYFDTDFNTVLYLTDTGRTWNNKSISIRDKVDSAFDIKVSATKEQRSNIIELVQVFRAKVVDVSYDALTLEVVGDPGKLVALEKLLHPYGIIEIARTGKVALERASGVNTEMLKASSKGVSFPA